MLRLSLLLGVILSVTAWAQADPADDAKLRLPGPLLRAHAHPALADTWTAAVNVAAGLTLVRFGGEPLVQAAKWHRRKWTCISADDHVEIR